MSPLMVAHLFLSSTIDVLASSYDDQDERVLDQVVRPRGHRVASLAEVMARPVGLARKAA